MEMIEKILLSLITLVVISVLGWAIYAAYDDSAADKFYLRKDSWECTVVHNETSSTVLLVGKVMISQDSPVAVCDNYKRK